MTWRSKRPGRSRAGSRTSGRLVAASTTMPVAGSKPSISASSWLRVCSRSSLETTPGPGPALADGVDLVDEDDGRGPFAGLGEQVADPGRPHAHEHLDEARARDREEGHVGLPGHGSGQQGLAGARGPDHQDAPRGHGTGPGVALGVLEEVDHLGDLGLGPLVAGHVGKGGLRPLLVEDLGLGAPDPERPLQAPGRPSLGQPPPEVAKMTRKGKSKMTQPRTSAPKLVPVVCAVIWTLLAAAR